MTPVLIILSVVTLILLGIVVILASISASNGDKTVALAAAVIAGIALATLIAFAVVAYMMIRKLAQVKRQLAAHLGSFIDPTRSAAAKERTASHLQQMAAASTAPGRKPYENAYGYDKDIIDILQRFAW